MNRCQEDCQSNRSEAEGLWKGAKDGPQWSIKEASHPLGGVAADKCSQWGRGKVMS